MDILNPLDWFQDAVGDLADGGALIGKAAGMAYGTAEGLFKGLSSFVEGLL